MPKQSKLPAGHWYLAKDDLLKNDFAFCPDHCISDGKLNLRRYLDEGWAWANCHINPKAFGSHVHPDLNKPIAAKKVPKEVRNKLDQILGSLNLA